MADQPETLVYKPEVTVLLESDDPIVASHCLNALNQQRYEWLDVRLAGKPGAFQITCRFSGVGDPQPGPKAAYDGNIVRATHFCRGFIAGYTTRRP